MPNTECVRPITSIIQGTNDELKRLHEGLMKIYSGLASDKAIISDVPTLETDLRSSALVNEELVGRCLMMAESIYKELFA